MKGNNFTDYDDDNVDFFFQNSYLKILFKLFSATVVIQKWLWIQLMS